MVKRGPGRQTADHDVELISACLLRFFTWAASILVGLERSFNGPAAGLRTYGLVSLASAPSTLSGNVDALAVFQFSADAGADGAEGRLLDVLKSHGVHFEDRSYALRSSGQVLEFSRVLRAGRRDGMQRLVTDVSAAPGLVGYTTTRISK